MIDYEIVMNKAKAQIAARARIAQTIALEAWKQEVLRVYGLRVNHE